MQPACFPGRLEDIMLMLRAVLWYVPARGPIGAYFQFLAWHKQNVGLMPYNTGIKSTFKLFLDD